MSSSMLAAASATAGAAAAAGLAVAFDKDSTVAASRRVVGVATVVGAGGLAGFLLWRLLEHPQRSARDFAQISSAKETRVLELIDLLRSQQPPSAKEAMDEASYAAEVVRWVEQLCAESKMPVSPALRIAAHAQGFERVTVPRESFPQGRMGYMQWQAAVRQRLSKRLDEIGSAVGLFEGCASRVRALVLRESKDDFDQQVLQDAVCLVFLDRLINRFLQTEGEQMLEIVLQASWQCMSARARTVALGFDFTPRVLAHLMEAVGAVEGIRPETTTVCSPNLPKGTIAVLRASWSEVHTEDFSAKFIRLLSDDAEFADMRPVFDSPFLRPKNLPKIVRMLVDLVGSDMQQFERVVYFLTVLGQRFGGLRAAHLASLKNALVRAVAVHIPEDDMKVGCMAWEAFSYTVCTVAAPHLLLTEQVQDSPSSMASSLPVPCASGAAGLMAVQGVALLEMCFRTTAESEYGPCHVVSRLVEARTWLLDAVRESHASICGHIAMCFADVDAVDSDCRLIERSGGSRGTKSDLQLHVSEKKRWEMRSIEVPLHVAELSSQVVLVVKDQKSYVKRSLRRTWVAALLLLETAINVSANDVAAGLTVWAGQDASDDVKQLMKRFAHFESFELPWDDMFTI